MEQPGYQQTPKMEGSTPGFRFYPTEEELIGIYLRHQLDGTRRDLQRVIPLVSIFDMEPWDLPNLAGELCKEDTEQWFFFVPRQEREARGGRPSRTTSSGYWKATGSPGYVYSSDNKVIGMKKTMVFYMGKAPYGKKTKWKLNEYRAIDGAFNPSSNIVPKFRHEFTLCRMYVISGNFRAFDRRPLEVVDQPVQRSVRMSTGGLEGDTTTVEATGSLDDMGATSDKDYPMWEWEQLNWA